MGTIDNDLRAIDQGWLDLHRAAFAGRRWLQMRVRIVTMQPMVYRTKVTASMPNHHGQFRPAAQWDVEVEELVEVEEFRTMRVWLSTYARKPARAHRPLRLAA
jgi:hypothetical protein